MGAPHSGSHAVTSPGYSGARHMGTEGFSPLTPAWASTSSQAYWLAPLVAQWGHGTCSDLACGFWLGPSSQLVAMQLGGGGELEEGARSVRACS